MCIFAFAHCIRFGAKLLAYVVLGVKRSDQRGSCLQSMPMVPFNLVYKDGYI